MDPLNHGPQSAIGVPDSERRAVDSSRTAPTSSAIRREFLARAASMFDGVLLGLCAKGDRRASNRAIGDALGVDEKRARAIRSGEAPLHVGDLFAMGNSPETRAAALAVLDTLRALIVEGAPYVRLSPEMRMLGVMSRTGELATVMREALADGVIDGDEPQRIAAAALTLTGESNALVRESMLPPPCSPMAKATIRMQVGRVAGGAR